ncbi:hypothetical protein [Asanoa iriomotensis]|uniref:2-phospho-L-lactate guanylyltransferase n=1 Tax=Asanoa iriomotensis TaxID=234613 RepID=A0ABQ4BZ30_9ACTN|nr:hypothetical protein [Asanoa iriomotensis]GIF55789.1 hypothetical protein Air01nite_18840 [Asanoa iriomotensis]
MTRRVIVVLLTPVTWAPPGVDLGKWRHALAEDAVDLLATLNEVDPAIAALPADRPLADAVAWPSMQIYEVPTTLVNDTFAAAAADGYDQAAVIAADAPDLPGLILGKLFRPLTTKTLAVAPAETGHGLLGVASRLPAPAWLPPLDLDADVPATAIRPHAPNPAEVATAPPWRRLRGPSDLATLDQAVEGWDATRALLTSGTTIT